MNPSKTISLYLLFVFGLLSCHHAKNQPIDSIHAAMNNGIRITGKFVNIVPIDSSYYYKLYVNTGDSVVMLYTEMSLDTNEVRMLKHGRSVLKLTYQEHYNPISKALEKTVQYMEPLYDMR